MIILLDSGVIGNICNPNAANQKLDADLIICATCQSLELQNLGRKVIVATTNVRHLSRFVAAATWQEIIV